MWFEYSLKWADSQAIPPATFVALVLSILLKGLPWWFIGKESACQCRRHRFSLLGQEDPLEKEIVTHSSILAWEIPWTEELCGLPPKGSRKSLHNWATKHRHHCITESPGWHKQAYSCCLVARSCPTLSHTMDCSLPGSFSWDFPGKNAGVDCYFLLQGTFLTHRLNPHLLTWQMGSLPLSHQGSLGIPQPPALSK